MACLCMTEPDPFKPCPEPREAHREGIKIHSGPDREWKYYYTCYSWRADLQRQLAQIFLAGPPRDQDGQKTEEWRAAWREYRAPYLHPANPRGAAENRDAPCDECGHELEYHMAAGLPCLKYSHCQAFKMRAPLSQESA